MPVRTSFTAGEVLTAADLTDTFASKSPLTSPTFTGTVTLPETIVGAPSPNRNLLYNGAMQVHQRGTSDTNITAGTYRTADRWREDINSLGTWTQTIENDAPSGSGFRKSFKMLCTTAASSPTAAGRAQVFQRLEGQDVQRIAKGTASAQQLTLSFWVKSNVTGTYIVYLFDNDNTRSVSASYSITASATWEKKTITFPADTTGVLDNDNNESLVVYFGLAFGSDRTSGTLQTTWGSLVSANLAVGQTNLAAATNNYWQITGVQLEVGPVATPFEFKSYGQELRECQRYYQRFTAQADNHIFGSAMCYATTAIFAFIPFRQFMRTAPTAVEVSSTASDYQVVLNTTTFQNCTSVPTFNRASISGAQVLATSSTGNLVVGQASFLTSGSSNGFLGFSAEL